MFHKRVLYSQRYLIVGLVGLGFPLTVTIRVSRVGLALWLVSGLALNTVSRPTVVNKGTRLQKITTYTVTNFAEKPKQFFIYMQNKRLFR